MSRLAEKIDIMIGSFEAEKNTNGGVVIQLALAKQHCLAKEYDKMLACFRKAAELRLAADDYEGAAQFFDTFILEVFAEYDER